MHFTVFYQFGCKDSGGWVEICIANHLMSSTLLDIHPLRNTYCFMSRNLNGIRKITYESRHKPEKVAVSSASGLS